VETTLLDWVLIVLKVICFPLLGFGVMFAFIRPLMNFFDDNKPSRNLKDRLRWFALFILEVCIPITLMWFGCQYLIERY
jgi:hypothetical protein